jgi:serine-type D-Ala-D-Ala carboxypeptidase (penicillin-binding protein 5/6)
MKLKLVSAITILLIASLYILPASAVTSSLGILKKPRGNTLKPVITPAPPNINAKAFILIDVNSGKIIAEKNSDKKLPPASLTKMMTLYVISHALQTEQIKINDQVRISKNAWKTGGSRMFIKEGQKVSVKDLLKGIIVESGNDACVALSEYIGGNEKAFTDIMNHQAQTLGMSNSHFTDSTGLPSKSLYSTAKDLAILGRALIKDYPKYYHWYKQKWFKFNGIRQPNRNRLLWRDNSVDGIKTGHTKQAGYCLVSSAKKEDMRLIAVVLGSPNEAQRADDSQRLLNYGFRFYETHELYQKNKSIAQVKLYKGVRPFVNVGIKHNQYVTIPSGQYKRLRLETNVPESLKAPIEKDQKIGELLIKLDGKIIDQQSLYALEPVQIGGVLTRIKDATTLTFKGWFGIKG